MKRERNKKRRNCHHDFVLHTFVLEKSVQLAILECRCNFCDMKWTSTHVVVGMYEP